ncbi:MAG: helix-turn-helix transcriptional regulator [Flavobacteriales bacterium]|nr:helix-turn-helix transcriptional regulator [Flavobacteriales bacterium]
MDGVGVRIAWAREQRDLKQYWVANEAALDRARYNHIEKGKAKRIFIDELARIADVLRCSID